MKKRVMDALAVLETKTLPRPVFYTKYGTSADYFIFRTAEQSAILLDIVEEMLSDHDRHICPNYEKLRVGVHNFKMKTGVRLKK